jgi:hypothetical protein
MNKNQKEIMMYLTSRTYCKVLKVDWSKLKIESDLEDKVEINTQLQQQIEKKNLKAER